MPILSSDHLLDQATRLTVPPQSGPPRQVDLRRAISGAYYAVFHSVAGALADELVGKVHSGSTRYSLVYRALDHRALRELCQVASKSTPPARYASVLPAHCFGDQIRRFGVVTNGLQEERHAADYDPAQRYNTAIARTVIELAYKARSDFWAAASSDRQLFLTLLVFPPRAG